MIHHVGIVTSQPDATLYCLQQISPDLKMRSSFAIDKWSCVCYMYESGSGSAVELVVPWAGKLLQWLKDQGHTSLHHIAFQVPDIREKMKELKTRRVPLIDDEPTLGVEGLLVNFVYPPYMGIMVEIVEVPS